MSAPFTLEALLENLQSLPTLPEVAMKVLKLTSDPDADVSDLEEIVSNDPALTAKILRVANSSYYGLSHKVTTLKMALVVLGFEETARMVRAISFLNAFPAMRVDNEFDYAMFWLHSITVAELVRGLAIRLKLIEASEASTGGLLHDMGHLVLATFFEDDFIQMIQNAREKRIPWHESEKELLGHDHGEIGAVLCTRWFLPDSIRSVVRYHHHPELAESHEISVYLTYLANRISSRYHLSMAPEFEKTPLLEDPAWQVLLDHSPNSTPPTPEQLVDQAELDVARGRDLHALLIS